MKRCLFLVEGAFDRQRLAALKVLFDPNKLEIIPFGTDILTSKGYAQNAKREIENLLAKDKLFKLSDFDAIVQVCDTDGCFIDDALVLEGAGHILYEGTHIKAQDTDSIRDAHRYKTENIRSLLSENFIRLYYNSTNIDHAFDGKQNPSKAFKRRAAIQMYQSTRCHPEKLISILFECEKSGSSTFEESWEFIQRGSNSLLPTSNLAFFLLDFYEELTEEAKGIVDECKASKR